VCELYGGCKQNCKNISKIKKTYRKNELHHMEITANKIGVEIMVPQHTTEIRRVDLVVGHVGVAGEA